MFVPTHQKGCGYENPWWVQNESDLRLILVRPHERYLSQMNSVLLNVSLRSADDPFLLCIFESCSSISLLARAPTPLWRFAPTYSHSTICIMQILQIHFRSNLT